MVFEDVYVCSGVIVNHEVKVKGVFEGVIVNHKSCQRRVRRDNRETRKSTVCSKVYSCTSKSGLNHHKSRVKGVFKGVIVNH